LIDHNNYFNEELLKRADKFIENHKLNLFIGSWNVAASTFTGSRLLEWLFPFNDKKNTPDFYIIGLQEIVSLNATNLILVSNMSKVDMWRNLITNTLELIDR
jgi:hypothetical protein